METSPRDAHVDVMNLHKAAPELVDALAPCALVESLRRVVEDRWDQAQDVPAGFDSAL